MSRCTCHRRPAGLAALTALATLAALGPPGAAAQGSDDAKPRIRSQMVVESDDSEPGVKVFFVGDESHQIRIDPVHAQRGYLGVGLIDLTPELRRFFGALPDRGVLVSRIEADSPAAGAGLTVGDVLTTLDDEAVASVGQVTQHISSREEGDRLRLGIRRERAARELTAVIVERARQQVDLGYAFRSCASEEECGGIFGDHTTAYRSIIPVAPEQLSKAVRELNRTFDSPEWQARMRRFQDGQESYEARLRRLEERIRELEELLARADGS